MQLLRTNKHVVSSLVFIGTLIILLSSIAGVHATVVVYIKMHHPPSAFQDPSGTYDGYTPGANIRFHLNLNVTVSLGGAVVAITNLTMTDTLPAGLTYVSGSQLSAPAAVSFSVVGQVLTWNWSNNVLNTVINPPETPPNEKYQATAEFNATVDSTVADNTYLINTAVARYNEVITHALSQPATTDTIWVARPILDISKQGPVKVENGADFNYVLTLNNTGHWDATGVNVTDLLPSGVMHTPGTSTASSGSFAVDSATQVVWTGTIGNVTGTHVVTITIPVTANTAASSVFDSASYTAYPSSTEFTHDSASWTVDVLHPSIDVTKSGPAQAHVDDTITYTITVTNTGDCVLSSVSVVDSLLGPIYSNGLAVGQTKTFTLTYTVKSSDPDPLVNTVTASGTDSLGKTVSDSASWSVDIVIPSVVPVGGHSVSLAKPAPAYDVSVYAALIGLIGVALVLVKRKR